MTKMDTPQNVDGLQAMMYSVTTCRRVALSVTFYQPFSDLFWPCLVVMGWALQDSQPTTTEGYKY